MADDEKQEGNEKKQWRFHSNGKHEIVYDPINKRNLCTFVNHELITDDPAIVKGLQERGYEEWVVFSEDDMITLTNGEKIRLGDLPRQIANEYIGKPKRVAQELLGKVKGLSPFSKEDPDADKKGSEGDGAGDKDEEVPIKENQCPLCLKQFDTASGLNGHFAHCKPKEPEE